MKILGIDPGSRNCGFAIVENVNKKNILITAGVIKIKSRTLQEQLLEMNSAFDIIFRENNIDEVAMEDIFFAHNPQSVMKLAQFRGALSLKILHSFGKFGEYTPLQVKQAITGNGKATKEQVSFMVKRLLGLKSEIKPLDITDAIAVAITHIQRFKIN
jgi:crossover junction endodeoxyribonuclease RuvC